MDGASATLPTDGQRACSSDVQMPAAPANIPKAPVERPLDPSPGGMDTAASVTVPSAPELGRDVVLRFEASTDRIFRRLLLLQHMAMALSLAMLVMMAVQRETEPASYYFDNNGG